MREILGTVVVDEHGDMEVRVHTDLPAGLHTFRLRLDEAAGQANAGNADDPGWEPPILSVGEILPGFSLNREDWYSDDVS